jgi:FMN phosphatase YigB (HAD superfamily)/glycosyltransferase involved in cell wall biosynthesis
LISNLKKQMISVAIVHYHLEPGGVTRVIESASLALSRAGIPHVILTGGQRPLAWASHPGHRHISGLHYLTRPGDLTAEILVAQLRAAAAEVLGRPPDIWHFHNHSLGKNCLLPEVIARLAAAGERLILQIHDLAEAGRPANYPLIADCEVLYPVAPRIHYAFLNSRDLQTFTGAGLPPKNASLLPNSIALPVTAPSALPTPHPTILFAPIRGIRRKNLGELVLLAALAPPETWFAVSRAPLNPEALPVHDTWRKFTTKHRLPIEFDVVDRFAPVAGATTDFESWVFHATHFVTTSVAEGFGLPFLEAIAHRKPLLGRALPDLTLDHARHGIRAGRLYERLLVPLHWIDLPILHDYLTTELERNYRAYRLPLSQEIIDATLAALLHDDYLDFGNLPEPLQQGVIERLSDPAERSTPLVQIDGKTQVAADWLAATIAERTPTAVPAQLAPYAPMEYQKLITDIYHCLAGQAAAPIRYLPAARILSAQLQPQSFHFLLSALKPTLVPKSCRAVIFDIYGTLLIAASGRVKPDPDADPILREILRQFHYDPPTSPSTELHAAVLRHHAAARVDFPEVDLRVLWREVLALEPDTDITRLVKELEDVWHPVRPMPGAEKMIQRLARSGISLGLLSNAQSHTLSSLGAISDLFAPELTLLSYRLGIAKPAPELFQILTDRLAARSITPAETLFVGNDPAQDIVPAAAAGFQTALFTGHPDSLRPGECAPDFTFQKWEELSSRF